MPSNGKHKHVRMALIKKIDSLLSEQKKLYSGPLRMVTFKAPEDLVSELDNISRMLGYSRSELIRAAVHNLLKEIEDASTWRVEVRRVRLLT